MRPFLLASVFLILESPLLSQDEIGASLTIRFVDGTNRFHVGEMIPVELSFKTALPETYDMSTRNYDRSGRLDMEQFHVTPPVRDPLQSYYSTGPFIGGGLGSSRDELRDWLDRQLVSANRAGH